MFLEEATEFLQERPALRKSYKSCSWKSSGTRKQVFEMVNFRILVQNQMSREKQELFHLWFPRDGYRDHPVRRRAV